jgi:hypothetical protein
MASPAYESSLELHSRRARPQSEQYARDTGEEITVAPESVVEARREIPDHCNGNGFPYEHDGAGDEPGRGADASAMGDS